MIRYLFLSVFLIAAKLVSAADSPELEDQIRSIANDLRCVVCQNLSVADSPSEMAQQMRGVIREQLQAGKNPQEIKSYFVSKYGEWVLLAPSTSGFSLLLWVLPYVAIVIGIVLALVLARRWTQKKKAAQPQPQALDSEVLTKMRNEISAELAHTVSVEEAESLTPLEQQRAQLFAELRELEFDYQAGKLSESDYTASREALEAKAAGVMGQLKSAAPKGATKTTAPKQVAAKQGPPLPYKGWQIAVGAIALLIFGVTLGTLLTKSSRPRESEQDTITGDFLTGTQGGGSTDLKGLIQQGRTAYDKGEWQKAIESFKKVLVVDPDQPEAHTYMGLILIQVKHADGALLAFDKALAKEPNFPLALWGKAMALYREKGDIAGARELLEKLLRMLPPGQDRAEVEKALAEIARSKAGPKLASETTKVAVSQGAEIQGKITISPKLKDKLDPQAVLFITARTAGSDAGPPIAVKKIDRPVFPLAYVIGPTDVMTQGGSFTGKVNLSVRLDKDGNPMTREPGNLAGSYKKNPAAVGNKNVDIVIDELQ